MFSPVLYLAKTFMGLKHCTIAIYCTTCIA